MSKAIVITQDNEGIAIYDVFIKEDKSIQPISGYTCDVDVVYPDGTTENLPAEITDAVNGTVLFIFDSDQTAQSGLHKLYFNLKDNNSYITAQSMVTYYVLTKKGGA